MRDFVYVDDVVDVNFFCLDKSVSGIYNCGTGKAQQFNDVALTVVNTLREQEGKAALSLTELSIRLHRIHSVPRSIGRQVSSLYTGGPHRAQKSRMRS